MSQTGQRYLTFTIPAIPSQESIQSTQLVNVTNNAMPGIYTINYSESFINYLGYKYYATNSNITSGNANLTVTNVPLNLAIYPKTPLIVTLSSPSATPSSTVSVLLGLNTSYNSFIESISPQTQLTLLSSNFTSTTFKGREVFNYTFEIPQNLVPGFYPVTFNVNYQIFGQQEQTTITTFVHVGYYNVSPILSDPIWGGQSNQVIPTPGMTGIPLTLTLINPLPYSLSNVNVTFILPPGISSPYTSYVIPSIGASGSGGNSAQIALTVNLAQNLSPGYHNVNYIITYTSSYGISAVKSTIPVYIYPASQVSVSLGNTTLYQGTQSIFPVVISDTGIAPISQVSMSLKTEGVSVIGFTNQTLNSLQPGANSTFLFTLSAQGISPGTYPVILTLTYNYEGQLKTSSYTVPINVLPSEDIVQVSVIPSEVFYGEINNVTIQLRDTANLPVTNAVLRLFGQPSLYSLSQNIINLGTLDRGKIYEVSLNLLPTVTSNTPLPLSVEVQYLIPGGGVVSQAYNFSLVATGLVDLVLQQPQVSFSNGSLTVTGILNNFGTASANFVTVYVNGNSTYIGSVPPNSPTPFSTTLFLPFINGSIHQHEIKIVISYEDSIYQPHNITYFINYTPTATHFNVTGFHNFHNFQRRNSILPEIIIFILIIVVIILAILLVLRRGKR
ncbi:COG1361 S-layer family protein [Metallosphaera hakonensis]|uniref:COG1361 S-layer family protein n=1 Tax=Metallosphaera hakonensis TaxID=79601 RepID=UPI000AAD9BC9|nr:hypothetical protein [Metallosphaera hakonensis]